MRQREARRFFWKTAFNLNLAGWPLFCLGFIGQDAHWYWLFNLGIGGGAILLTPLIWLIARFEAYPTDPPMAPNEPSPTR